MTPSWINLYVHWPARVTKQSLNNGWPQPHCSCFFVLYVYKTKTPRSVFWSCKNQRRLHLLTFLSKASSCPAISVRSPLPPRRLLFLFPSSVCQWQLWESTAACWCHVNQIRCHNRKSVRMHGRNTVTHAHDLLPLQAKCRPSRHRYADMNLLWVKGNGALSQTASYLLQRPVTRRPARWRLWRTSRPTLMSQEKPSPLF